MEWLVPYDLTEQTPTHPGKGLNDVLGEWLGSFLTAWTSADLAEHPDSKKTNPLPP